MPLSGSDGHGETADGRRGRTGAKRPYRAAPPITHLGEAGEGAEIITEFPNAAGLVLRAALRDLGLWISAPTDRSELFAPDSADRRVAQIRAAGLDEALWVPLFALAELTGAPSAADANRLAHAATSIARWADERDALGTRLAFMQAVALLRPCDPKPALEVARLARDAG